MDVKETLRQRMELFLSYSSQNKHEWTDWMENHQAGVFVA
jgi:hypothetical protein